MGHVNELIVFQALLCYLFFYDADAVTQSVHFSYIVLIALLAIF